MLTELRTFAQETLEEAYQVSEQMTDTFNQIIHGKVSFAEILPLLQSAVKMQSLDGLIRLADGEETPPSDIRVDLWYMPTYSISGIMIYYLLNGDISISDDSIWKDSFSRLLTASTGRGFMGHGIDDLIGMCKAVDLFCAAGLPDFLKQFSNFCPKFTQLVRNTERNLADSLDSNKVYDSWGRNLGHYFHKSLANLRNKKTEVFVYGTLMKDRNNSSLMADADYAGEGMLKNYAIYELGGFPGIQLSAGNFVKGELYFVDNNTLNALNQLEGEGTLYRLTPVTINQGRCILEDVFTYVYIGKVHPESQIDLIHQPWGKKQNGYVWYACYGSNLLKERFLCYLQGGKCRYNGRTYKGCTDKTVPKSSKAIMIPFEMYYGNHSASWNNAGVSFLDSSKAGQTLGRMHLITEEQFYEIHRQEGSGDNWYNQLIYLGKDTGFEIYTFTNKTRREECEPDENYLSVMRQGLTETYPEITKKELKSYSPAKNGQRKK